MIQLGTVQLIHIPYVRKRFGMVNNKTEAKEIAIEKAIIAE
jgi:hypothetical protein